MAILSNGELVPTPAPGLARYGLFSAATVTDDLGPRGIAAGFQVAEMDQGVVLSYDANCETHPEKVFVPGQDYLQADPYWIYATQQCGSVGRRPAEVETAVRRRLASMEQGIVEAHVWGSSDLPSEPSLVTHVGTVTVVPSAPGSGAAIAALEEEFYGFYGYAGVIHINMRGYANLAYGNMMERQGGQLKTPMGSVYSVGSGYGINGPLNVAPAAGNVWAFMTAPLMIKRSEVIVPPVMSTLDRTTNQYMALAERVYAHTWVSDVVVAVEVPLASPKVDTEAA